MTVRSDQFMMALLKWKNMPVSTNNVRSMVIWKLSEGSNAIWNPMDTEWYMPGSTNYNEVGVKNYPDIVSGIEAFWSTLEQPEYQAGYGPIIQALEQSLPPAMTAQRIYDSPWGSKPTSGDVQEVLANFEFYASMPIAGSATVVLPTPDNTPAPLPEIKEETMPVVAPNGDIVSMVITPAGDILELTRKKDSQGTQLNPDGQPENLSVIDVTAKYPQYKGATVA